MVDRFLKLLVYVLCLLPFSSSAPIGVAETIFLIAAGVGIAGEFDVIRGVRDWCMATAATSQSCEHQVSVVLNELASSERISAERASQIRAIARESDNESSSSTASTARSSLLEKWFTGRL